MTPPKITKTPPTSDYTLPTNKKYNHLKIPSFLQYTTPINHGWSHKNRQKQHKTLKPVYNSL